MISLFELSLLLFVLKLSTGTKVYTLKSLQHLLQDFQSVSDHFETLYY